MGYFFVRKMSVQKKNSSKKYFALQNTKSFRSRCKMPGCTKFSHLLCEECKVHLCITSKRNCFYKYHHNNHPEKNDTARQNKSKKGSRHSTKTTHANEQCSGQRRSSGAVNKQKKCTITITSTSAQKRSSCQRVFEYTTRSQMCEKVARELIVAESPESQKEIFMTKIDFFIKCRIWWLHNVRIMNQIRWQINLKHWIEFYLIHHKDVPLLTFIYS